MIIKESIFEDIKDQQMNTEQEQKQFLKKMQKLQSLKNL